MYGSMLLAMGVPIGASMCASMLLRKNINNPTTIPIAFYKQREYERLKSNAFAFLKQIQRLLGKIQYVLSLKQCIFIGKIQYILTEC